MMPVGPIAWSSLAALVLAAVGGAQDPPKEEHPALAMSRAVACRRVDGYEKFVPLPDASLTSEDKLLVYYRPLHFKVEAVEKPKPGYRYRARFRQDGRVRRKGEKTVLSKKDQILEYDPAFETPYERIYLINTIGLKGLPPGEYEFDIVLHDALDEGSTATQTLPFKIVPTPKFDPPPKSDGPDEPGSPPGPAGKQLGSKAKPNRTRP